MVEHKKASVQKILIQKHSLINNPKLNFAKSDN